MNIKNYQIGFKFIEKYSVIIASLLAIICVVSVGNYLGPALSFDTNSYESYTVDLIRHNFNFSHFLEDHYPRLATYAVPIYVMSVIKFFAQSDWKSVFLIFNYICVAAMLLIFTRSLNRIEVSNLAISLSVLLMIISIDHLIWPRFVLTDTMYSLLLLAIFTQPLSRTFLTIKGIVLFIALLVLLMFTRPTALPVVLAVLVFATIYHSDYSLFKTKNILLMFGAGIMIFALVWSYFFYQYALGHISQHKYLDYIYRFIAEGAIVTEREGSNTHFSGHYLDYVRLYLLRVVFFFSPVSKDFSLIHNVCNLIWLGSYGFSILGWFYLSKKKQLSCAHNKILTGVLILILAVACYHSAILLDYDWRYRYPVILPMLMSVAIIFTYVLNIGKNRVVNEK